MSSKKVNSIMKAINVFPNRVFTENLQLTKEQNDSILDEIDFLVDKQQVDETNYGWITPNGRTMGEQTGKLTKLLVNRFASEITPQFNTGNKKIEMADLKLTCVMPQHAVPHFITKYSWYTAVVWLQTSNQGCHLYFDDMGPRHFATPKGFDEWTHYIKPAKNKVVYFPSHLISGFTSNESMMNNFFLSVNFLVK